MRAPRLVSTVDRRILVNYRVDPEALRRVLPDRFRPQLVDGAAVAGICLIRLTGVRLRGVPAALGLTTENAAHRIAVEWDGPDGPRTGVYVPRRDTSSWPAVLLGGRVFPGVHGLARFTVAEHGDDLHVALRSRDGGVDVDAHVVVTPELTGSRLFASVDAASRFFESGDVGWSPTRRAGELEGMRLATRAWQVDPARVVSVRSSFFDDPVAFPAGSAELDCALVMRRVPVSWSGVAPDQLATTA